MEWINSGSLFAASFLASFVEFVEALTVVMAAGISRGWRSAIAGSFAALMVLALAVAIFGPALQAIPLNLIQFVVGTLLLLFGARWLRKAALRAAGVVPLHDEEAAFFSAAKSLGSGLKSNKRMLDGIGFLASFKIVMLEGLEVIFIVIAIGSGKGLGTPIAGALMALITVIGLGIAVRKPLSRVPENTLKYAVGVVLTAFGAFWTGEGLGVTWPGGDFALPVLAAFYFLTAMITTFLCRQGSRA